MVVQGTDLALAIPVGTGTSVTDVPTAFSGRVVPHAIVKTAPAMTKSRARGRAVAMQIGTVFLVTNAPRVITGPIACRAVVRKARAMKDSVAPVNVPVTQGGKELYVIGVRPAFSGQRVSFVTAERGGAAMASLVREIAIVTVILRAPIVGSVPTVGLGEPVTYALPIGNLRTVNATSARREIMVRPAWRVLARTAPATRALRGMAFAHAIRGGREILAVNVHPIISETPASHAIA